MTKLYLVLVLFFANPDFLKTETTVDREVKILEAKLVKILSKKATNACQQTCMNKLRIATNICSHVAPANRQACLNTAFDKYDRCSAGCQ
jgi:hypothetical protein